MVKKGSKILSITSRRNPRPGIGKLQTDLLTFRIESARDNDSTLPAHSTAGIDNEVGEYLLELSRVAGHLGNIGLEINHELDILKQGLTSQQFHGSVNDRIDLVGNPLTHGLSAEFQKTRDNMLASEGLVDDFLEVGAPLRDCPPDHS